ncbi:inositol 2-dehydrogenase [Bacillus sp. REN16]|uniref:inositol 2-dehydrogenase n=1 Tax=Bacillus sp. REN16 TaxID=2887296 RepID=UPI001E56A342|nr:inositol 2-dehydrogenase [Bacillus sp. REN16]MCC3356860.1 inositol 2-dehydrogenase [Bacillus sp. REN16]
MGKVKVGIIGAGRIGQIHAGNILQSESVKLKAVSDVYLDHLIGTRLEAAVDYLTNDYREILADSEIDAVFICSSTDTHVDIIVEAAKAGKHIFCEKPISFDFQETHRAIEAVQEAGVYLQVGFNRRFDKHFRKAFEEVRKGTIGQPHIIKITSRDPEAPPEAYVQRSGGMFIDMTIHDFDMIRYLSGQNVKEIYVNAANLVDPMFGRHDDVDTAIITVTFEDGSLGVIDNSRKAAYGYDQRIEVFGDKGVVTVANERPTNVEISSGEAVTVDKPKYFFLERYQDAYVAELNAFIDSIVEKKPVLCNGNDGLQAELLAYAAKLSVKEKRPVSLNEIEFNAVK